MKALVSTLLFLLIAANEAKVYSKCELASILKRHGMDRYYGYSLGNWICMAYHESRYNSRVIGPPNRDGSRDYGIFQINSRWWCNNNKGPTANGCKKPCSVFINDDIRDDIACAKRIVRDPQRMNACTGSALGLSTELGQVAEEFGRWPFKHQDSDPRNEPYGIRELVDKERCERNMERSFVKPPIIGLPGGNIAKEKICHNGLMAADCEIDNPAFLFLLL